MGVSKLFESKKIKTMHAFNPYLILNRNLIPNIRSKTI